MERWKIAGKVLLYILVAVIMILVLLYLGATVRYFDFFVDAESKFLVPGLNTDFVQQGFEYVEEEELYLVSGYMDDGSASRIYIREEDGDTHSVELKNADGTDCTLHCGGICHNGRYVFLAGDGGVEVLTLDDVLDGGYATIVGHIEVGFDISFCTFYDGHLLVGEFYRAQSHETDPSHWLTTPSGQTNPALITVFQADSAAAFGIDPTPVAAISIPELVQGICFTSSEEIVLSTSYGPKSSHLYFHKIQWDEDSTISLSGVQVPLMYLDSASLTDSVTAPPMAQELVCRDGQVYIMNESASNKYIFGKFIRGYQVFAYGG